MLIITNALFDLNNGEAKLWTNSSEQFEHCREPQIYLFEVCSDEHRQLVDTCRVIHPGDETGGGTFGAWTGKREGARIDWILHSPEFTTLNATINYHNDSDKYPSDHYPVEAVIRIKL